MLRIGQIEAMAEWCDSAERVSPDRVAAWHHYFGEDDPRPVSYMEGAEDPLSCRRRFLGWFMFGYRLPDGRCPAQLAAEALFEGRPLEEARAAIGGARYILAIITSIVPGRSVFLELEDERFEVRSRVLSRLLERGAGIAAYVLPVRRGLWLHGPGWLQWPVLLGPGMRATLKSYQPDPVEVERLLQMRGASDAEEAPSASDLRSPAESLEDAVARMTATAKESGKDQLVMSEEEWQGLVQGYLDREISEFVQDIVDRIGDLSSVDEANRFLRIAMDIWNNVPQPDRGGRSAARLAYRE